MKEKGKGKARPSARSPEPRALVLVLQKARGGCGSGAGTLVDAFVWGLVEWSGVEWRVQDGGWSVWRGRGRGRGYVLVGIAASVGFERE